MSIHELISEGKIRVSRAVAGAHAQHRKVISRYTAAIAVNFTDWLGKTFPWVRHEKGRFVVMDNLRSESVQDHVGMLLRFAGQCRAWPETVDYIHTDEAVASIRALFAAPVSAGLAGLALCAALENTSEVFIPDLAQRAKTLGCEDLTYTDVHGAADEAHSRAFLEAVEAEQTMGYRDSEFFIREGVERAVVLIEMIYSS